MLNRVEIEGGLVRDPKLEYLPSGAPVWEATVALNEAVYSSKEGGQTVRTHYIAVQAWGWAAETFAELNLTRGEDVYVLGSLSQQTVEKKDGSKESKTRVRALQIVPTKRRTPDAPRPMGGQNAGGFAQPQQGQQQGDGWAPTSHDYGTPPF